MMAPHQAILNDNVASLRILNTWNAQITHILTGFDAFGRPTTRTARSGARIIARLEFGGVEYIGEGTTVAEALRNLDDDILAAARDCDCVLPEQCCSGCCPKEVNLENIPF